MSVALARKPSWLKAVIPAGEKYQFIKQKRKTLKLATVCEEARCPNIGECWSSGTATFMIMGDSCTRGCRFCSVMTKKYPDALDPLEPLKLGETLAEMRLDYVVITTVDRDDLVDQGSRHTRACIEKVQELNPNMLIEILMPDFRGDLQLVDEIIYARPAVMAHNIETVENLTPTVRDKRAGYRQSLKVLEYIKKKNSTHYTKSSIMLGFGEKQEEVLQTMKDLRGVGVDFFTLGQYLRPTKHQLKVSQYIPPAMFDFYRDEGLKMGFRYVASGPLVRSSYKAAEFFIKSIVK
jgi:lipoic acid synthetase